MGYITSGIGFDTDLWNEMETLRDRDGFSRSQHVQTALRRYHKLLKSHNISFILESLTESELEVLKTELHKKTGG